VNYAGSTFGDVSRSRGARVFGLPALQLVDADDYDVAGKRLSRYLFARAILITMATVHGCQYLADAICADMIDCIVPVLVAAGTTSASVSTPGDTLYVLPGTKLIVFPMHPRSVSAEEDWHIRCFSRKRRLLAGNPERR
jgi:hypothetical protein